MQMTGAQILIKSLINQGVDTVFGYPGGAVLNIYDALYQYSGEIKHILTCHEQNAAHAADGYSRSTGKTGVVIATSGPGATNLVTGIATAFMDSIPMVAITGNVAVSLLGKDSFQEVDIAGITMPITKHNYIVKDVNQLEQTVADAFRIARSGRPGPVLIDVTKDVTAALCEFKDIKVQPSENNYNKFTLSDIEKAVKLIKKSKKPFIYAGGGIVASGASSELMEFAKKINAPVSVSLMAMGVYPFSDENYMGMIGMHGSRASAKAVLNADLVLAIGARFSDRVACNPKSFAPNAKIIHIDIDEAEISKNVSVKLSLTGDVKAVLTELNTKLNNFSDRDFLDEMIEYKKQHPIDETKSENDFPAKIIQKADELTKGNAIFATEVGQHQMWAAQFLKLDKPRRFISSGGLGTMGFGFGAAIGAKAANPDKTVFNIAGDGSFHMNLNELSTCVTKNLPVIVLLMNNNVLGMVRQWQKVFYQNRFSQTTLNKTTDYVKLAQAFGANGYTISKEEDIEKVLKEAIASKKTCVINCIISEDANVLPMVAPGDSLDNQILDI